MDLSLIGLYIYANFVHEIYVLKFKKHHFYHLRPKNEGR